MSLPRVLVTLSLNVDNVSFMSDSVCHCAVLVYVRQSIYAVSVYIRKFVSLCHIGLCQAMCVSLCHVGVSQTVCVTVIVCHVGVCQ